MLSIFALAYTVPSIPIVPQYQQMHISEQKKRNAELKAVPAVPFLSQFKDITSAKWQKVGCGVTSLAMIIDFYNPNVVSVNTLLEQGIARGAYLKDAGWTYAGLIGLSKRYGLDGNSYDYGKQSADAAFAKLKLHLKDGPVIVSVHYKFDPKSTIPHLVVINGLDNDMLHYNDPAAKSGDKEISVNDFLKAWKKRFIVIRPLKDALSSIPSQSSQFLSLANSEF